MNSPMRRAYLDSAVNLGTKSARGAIHIAQSGTSRNSSVADLVCAGISRQLGGKQLENCILLFIIYCTMISTCVLERAVSTSIAQQYIASTILLLYYFENIRKLLNKDYKVCVFKVFLI
jgi:hypothetical protein